MIYHEGGRRYIPIKFSVRGRDLASAIQDLQGQLTEKVKLPTGYNYTWAGEFDSLRKEQQRLALIIPVSVLIILVLLYIQFRTWKDAFIIVGTLPFAAIGGVFTLFFTHTSFSISAAVGFTSLTGVATLGAVVFLSGIRRAQREEGPERGLRRAASTRCGRWSWRALPPVSDCYPRPSLPGSARRLSSRLRGWLSVAWSRPCWPSCSSSRSWPGGQNGWMSGAQIASSRHLA